MTSWSHRVHERLRSPLLERLRGEPGVWIVGGAVRDALLGVEPREIDLVVEGDAVALAQRLGVVDAVHDRFGTATVEGNDLTTARTETYAAPGALPDVALGASVERDLARRDFTVNALAVRLADGEGAAWPGALEDLGTGRLRVLHERSFLDDPTRLLRMARYAARLGFAAEPETARLAREAIAGGALATVSGTRIGTEVRLALEEPLPAVFTELARDGLGAAAIHPAFPDPTGLGAASRGHGAFKAPQAAWLGAALLDADGVREGLDRLAFPVAEREAVVAAAGARPLAEALMAADRPSEIARLARGVPDAALDVAAALGAGDAVARWRGELSDVALDIGGADLLAAGLSGPAIGAALRAALDARLDGTAPDRDAQLRIALDAVA
jgi:tRNA nucleotidyltransferase (CCA-adding enzyme)